MKYLGLDLGTKTLGISISDLTHTIASTYKTLRYDNNLESLLVELKKIINEEQIEMIVLGLPKNMNNTIGESAERCLNFKTMIEKNLNIKVEMQDERLTTVEATNYMIEANISRKKRKQKVDSLAANIILQTYLDRKRN
ncbi:MAG: Holliday junction resolvase RuvX [Bacilli bacterium]|nr:Holliday junction resolvase RuvX [Bacilli bacterium]MBP3921309.1 Holliday junction resolvase RuvX [Bacilli bacterium]